MNTMLYKDSTAVETPYLTNELPWIRGELTRLENWKSELDNMPDGTLYINFSRGKPYYLRAIEGTRQSINRDIDLVYKLARKRYLMAAIGEHSSFLTGIHRRSKSASYKSTAPWNIESRSTRILLRFRKAGLDPIRISRSAKQYSWSIEPYRTNPYEMPSRTYETPNGVICRSKSEQTIGKTLEDYGIPYRYEPEVNLDVSWMTDVQGLLSGRFKNYYPDFVIMGATGELFLWEHLGRVDSEQYRLHTMEKISAYRQDGLVDDAHLILTYEKDLEKPETLERLLADRILPYV